MEEELPYVQVSDDLAGKIGSQMPGTRMYKRSGNQDEFTAWFDLITQHFEGCVSPGGAAARAHVSRAAVYKRMKAGKLTAFLFYAPQDNRGQPLYLRIFRSPKLPYCYIPSSECRAWGDQIRARVERLKKKSEAGKIDEADEDVKALAEDMPDDSDESMAFLEDGSKAQKEMVKEGERNERKPKGN